MCSYHNSYAAAAASDSRPHAQVVAGALEFAREFKRKTGFAPSGWGTYFVHREGARAKMVAGAYRWALPI